MTGNLFAELKRRKVVKVGAVYLVAAWLAVQAASIGFPAFEAPPWALRIFILVLFLGFPIVLLLTWVLDLTPEGVRIDASPVGNKRVIGVAIGLVALAFVWYFVGQPSVRRGQDVVDATPTHASNPTPVVDNKSIAVLAFTDLSAKQDQEYFSDGMSEEILNALAQIRDLRVAGRTSSFSYKGRNVDLRTIGKALGVAHILEGSVRTQGNKVRITAQLIRSTDGIHLWSKQYDGDLSDVFKLQDQIARAIADELQLALEGGQKSRLVAEATTSPEAYQLFLRASEVLHKRDYAHAQDAIAWLEQALVLDPKFARAESQLALVQMVVNLSDPNHVAEAERHARAAIAMDPTLAQPVYVLGLVMRYTRHYAEARPYLDRALQMQPRDPSAHMYLGQWLIVSGYTKQGTEALDRAIAIDPMLPNAVNWRGWQYLFAGDIDSAEAMFARTEALGLSLAKAGLGEVALRRGNLPEARRLMIAGLNPRQLTCGPIAGPPEYDALLADVFSGDAGAHARALQTIDACLDTKPFENPAWTVILLMRLERYAQALEVFAGHATRDDAGIGFRVWAPKEAPIRRLPQFSAAASRIGWVDAWEKYGPPDACKRTAPRQYVCQ
jgi:TolB-like protein/Flp pilus assembly protein TadD